MPWWTEFTQLAYPFGSPGWQNLIQAVCSLTDEIIHDNLEELRKEMLVTFNPNKSPTRCNNFPVYYPDVSLQLNMFRTFSSPSSGAQWLQWQPLVSPSCHSRAVSVVGPVDPTTNTAPLSPRYEGKTRGCHFSHSAPDDGRENARNMLSCKQTSG